MYLIYPYQTGCHDRYFKLHAQCNFVEVLSSNVIMYLVVLWEDSMKTRLLVWGREQLLFKNGDQFIMKKLVSVNY